MPRNTTPRRGSEKHYEVDYDDGVSIGIVQFPCPACSAPTPVSVMDVAATSRFECTSLKCKFTRTFGANFPSIKLLLNEFAHLAPDIARAKIVDKLTAWYLDWSDLRD